jgi:hypothetical protein
VRGGWEASGWCGRRGTSRATAGPPGGAPAPPPPATATATATPTPINTTNRALSHPVTSSSNVNATFVAANAVDGNAASYWESANNAFPQALTVDMGASFSINRVVLKLPSTWGARTQTVTLSGSTDNVTYTTIAASAGYVFDPASANTVPINFAATTRRYLRLSISANTGWPAGQISELEVY